MTSPYANLSVIEHPLAAHLLSGLRDVRTPPEQFRHLARRAREAAKPNAFDKAVQSATRSAAVQ